MKPGAMGIKALVPSSIVGAIIGKGGEEMKRIKTESGAYVRLSQNDKYFPNSQERPCYIEGEPEEIVKVLDFMQEKVRSDRPPRGNQIAGIDQKRKEQLIIIIGPNAAGKCIGKGGENVKRLKSEYNVYVRCMAKEDIIPGLEERTVTISGEQENVSKAAKDILDLALTCKNGGTDKNLDYDNYMGGGAPGGAQAGGQFGGPPQQGYNGNNMGNNQYGGNQGYQGNNYNNQQQQGGYNAPPAQGGYNAPQSGFNQPPQQFNNAPQQAPPQGQFPPNQGIQQYNQPPPNQYNAAPVQQYGAPPAQQYGAPPPVQQYNQQQPAPAYTPPVNNAPPAANIAVQQYPSQGGYQGAPNGGPGPNQGNNQGGGYQGNQQGYQGGNPQGGYQGGNQGGGYQGNNQGGGYQGGNQGNQGGYNGGNQGGGGYQGNRGGGGGGYQGNNRGGNNRGNYGGGRGGSRGGRGK